MQQALLTVSELYLLWEDERAQSYRPPDLALIASLEALALDQGVHLDDVGTLLARARVAWNPDLHPRGRDGKFIETWNFVNIPWSWKDTLAPIMVRAQVVDITPDRSDPGNPTITVALVDPETGKASSVMQKVKPRDVEQAPRTKARLPQEQRDVYDRARVPAAPGEEPAAPMADVERQARREAYAKDGVDLSDGIDADEVDKMAAALSGETKISSRSNPVTWDTKAHLPLVGNNKRLNLESRLEYTDAISDNTNDLGSSTRILYQDRKTGEWIVSNEWLNIEGKFQGQGIGTEYTQQWEDYWIAHGVRKMKTHASLSVGGYAWARAGYTWPEDEDEFDASQEQALDWISWVIAFAERDEDEVTVADAKKLEAQAENALHNKDLPTPFEISELGREEGSTEWVGKDALMGSDWYGEKILPTMPGVDEGAPLRRVSLTELPSALPAPTWRRVARNQANGIDRANVFWTEAVVDQNTHAFEVMGDRTWSRLGNPNPSTSPTTDRLIESALGLMETNPKIQAAEHAYGDVPILAFETLPLNAMGIYLGDIIAVADPAEPTVRDSLQTIGPRFNIDTSMYGTLRHEYGHHVHSMLPEADRARWEDAVDEWGGELGPDGVNDVIRQAVTDEMPPSAENIDWGLSLYGRSNEKEAFAETFALVTHPDYKPDTVVSPRIKPLIALMEEFIARQPVDVPSAPGLEEEEEALPLSDVARQARRKAMAADGVDLSDGINVEESITIGKTLTGEVRVGDDRTKYQWNTGTYSREKADILTKIKTNTDIYQWGLNPTRIGGMDRTLMKEDDGKWVVYNNLLMIDPEFQGQGVGTELFQYFEDYWIAHDVEAMKVHATFTVGGFAWARMGYDWNDEPKFGRMFMESNRRSAIGMLEKVIADADADPSTKRNAQLMMDKVESIDDVTEWPTPFDISELGRRDGMESWPGKRAMLGASWDGVKHLPKMSDDKPEPEPLPMIDVERTVRQRAMTRDKVNVVDGIDEDEAEAMLLSMSGPIGGGFSLRMDRWEYATKPPNGEDIPEDVWFFGVVLDDRGIVSGKITRNMVQDRYTRAWHVNNSEFALADELQGQGIGTETTQRLEDYWIAHGISDVRVTAGGTVGGYAWARAGFGWDPEQFRPNKKYVQDTMVLITGNEVWPQEVRDRAREMWQQAEKATDVDELPTPFEISELGRDFTTEILGDRPERIPGLPRAEAPLVPMWAGKAAMLAQARNHHLWQGSKTLPPMAPAEPVPEILPMVDVERQMRQRSMADDGVNMLDGIDDTEAAKVMAALSGEATLANGKTYTWRFEDSTDENFSLRSGSASQRVFRGFVYDENDRSIGRITREVTYPKNGDPFVYNALVVISPEFTGQGIGTEMTQHIEDYWIAHDMHTVRVNAGESVGGYAWARAGFDWDPDNFASNQLAARWMLRALMDDGDEITIAQAKEWSKQVKATKDVTQWPTPFEISELGRKPGDTSWPGKRAMLGTQWSGVKTLPAMTPQRPLPVVDMDDLDLVPPSPVDVTESAPAIYFDVEPDFIDPAPPTPPPPTTRFQQVDLRTELAGALIEPIRRRMVKRANDPVPDETYNWRAWKPVFDTPVEERERDWGRPFAIAAMDIWGRGNPGEYSPFGTINIDRDPPSPEGKEAIDRILDAIEANPKIRAAEDRYGTVPIVGVETLPYEALGVYMTDIIAVNPSAARGFEPNPLTLAENVDLSLNGTLRHEYGHHVYSMLSSEDQGRWAEVHRAWGGDLGNPDAVNAEAERIRAQSDPDPYEYSHGLSFYGRTNSLEAFGETFALVTHPDYDPAKVDPRIKPMADLMEEFVRTGPSQDADRAALADAGVPEVEPIYQSSLTNPDTPRTRGVSAQEFAQLAAQGKQRLDTLMDNESSPDALNDDAGWQRIKDSAWESLQVEWGGRTFDAHTGAVVADDDPRYALTIKQPGMETVQLPVNSDRQTFDAAMDQARAKFADAEDGPLWMENAHLGVFRNEDIGQYEIDPVLLVDTHEEVESIGAYTNATGGAYKFQDGNGYWPPYIAQGEPSGTTEEEPAGVGEVARPSQGAEANVGVESVPA